MLILVSCFGEPSVPPHQVGPPPVQECLGNTPCATASTPRVIQNALHRNGMYRRLGYA